MNLDLAAKLYALPGIILGLTVHEYAHALAAYRLGDETAREDGRLSLNPLRHIDPMGFLFLLIAGFGWAKPVRFDRGRLRWPRRDEALIALAGPLSNLVLGLVLSLAYFGLALFLYRRGSVLSSLASTLFIRAITINYGLFIFNLIPIPPLDGSHLFFTALRLKPQTEAAFYRWGSMALFGILILGTASNIDLLPIGKLVTGLAKLVFAGLGKVLGA